MAIITGTEAELKNLYTSEEMNILKEAIKRKAKKDEVASLPSNDADSKTEMSIPDPIEVHVKNTMSNEEYMACSMMIAVCKNMIQKSITDAAEKNGVSVSDALKNCDAWIKGFVDFPFPFFNFEQMQEQDYKNDEFSLSANPEVIEAIVNIKNVPDLKNAVIGALKDAGPKGNLASYSNTDKKFTYFGVLTAYQEKDIAMRIVEFSMNMKNTEVKSLCGGVQKTHLDTHYRTYVFTADKEMMIMMQSKMKDKTIEIISQYFLNFLEEFYKAEYEKYKKMMESLIK